MSKELNGETVVLAFIQKLLNHLGGELLVEVELEGVVDHQTDLRDELGDGHVLSNTGLESLSELVVTVVVFLDSLIEGADLGEDDRGGKVAHTEGVVGDGGGVVLELLNTGDSHVLGGESFVGTSVDSGLSSNIRIVSQQETTLTRVDHLVGLTADGAGNTNVPGVLIAISDTQGVGAILEEDGVILITEFLDTVHVSDLTTHVRDEDVVAVGVLLQLELQVFKVDDHVHGRLDVNSLSTGVLNGTGNSAKGEGVTEDLATGLESSGLHHEHDSGSARVEGDTVLVPGVVSDSLLALTHGGLFGLVDVVTVETTGFHNVQSGLLTFDGDRIGSLDVTGDISTVLESVEMKEEEYVRHFHRNTMRCAQYERNRKLTQRG